MKLTKTDLNPPPEFEELIAEIPTLGKGKAPAPYPHDEQDADGRDGPQDSLEGLGAGGPPNTARAAVKLGWDWVHAALFLGVGYCLRVIRSLFNVEALWLDAETAFENAEHKHPVTDPNKVPWGVPIWWTNGRHGHVAISLGKGRCLTTDYVETGKLGAAKIADLAAWCGGTFRGWTEDINGVVVWNPKAPHDPWTIDDRIRIVENALRRAEKNKAPQGRVEGLRTWLRHLKARRSDQ